MTACALRRWTVRTLGANTNDAYGTGTPPREGSGDCHHVITDPDEISVMSDKWDKDLPSEGMRAKVNRRCHVSFVSL